MAKYYIKVVASGLVLAAALILILSNIGNDCANINFFWTTLNHKSLGLIMALSAIAGLITWHMLRWFVRGSWSIYRARKQARLEDEKFAKHARKHVEQERKEDPDNRAQEDEGVDEPGEE